MNNKSPSDFHPALTSERLTILAQALLTQCYETEDDLTSEYDSGYSRGCTRFDRQKNCLLSMPLQHSWLGIIDSSNRLTMKIDGVPFRFTSDDYTQPKKPAGTSIEEKELVQFEMAKKQLAFSFEQCDTKESNDNSPEKWRFFVEVLENQEFSSREFEVYFVGSNSLHEPVCVWRYSQDKVPVMTSTGNDLPPITNTPAAQTSLPNQDDKEISNDNS